MAHRRVKTAARKRVHIHCGTALINGAQILKIKCELVDALAEIAVIQKPLDFLVHQFCLTECLLFNLCTFTYKKCALKIVENTLRVIRKRQIFIVATQIYALFEPVAVLIKFFARFCRLTL